jgi:hypothetical protein
MTQKLAERFAESGWPPKTAGGLARDRPAARVIRVCALAAPLG